MNARFARVLAPQRFLMVVIAGVFFVGAARGDETPIVQASTFAATPDVAPPLQDDASATEISPEKRAPVSPTEAQLSLDVESAPMAQVFSLIEAMTQLRARYAAPPDAILSAHFDAEPLLPALEKMLDGSNWTAQLSGDSLFLNAPKNAQWEIWTGNTAPPTTWNLASGAREYSLPAVRLNSSPDAPSQLTATLDDNATRESPQEKVARLAEDALWQSAPLAFEARRIPSIRVVIGEGVDAKNAGVKNANAGNGDANNANIEIGRGQEKSESENKSGEKAASTRAVWLRCDFALRVVPARLYLSIATPAAATLFINGAPVLARRSGQSRVEISQFVRRGANRVALFWKNAPPLSSSEALLRYEWQSDLAP